MNGQRGMNRTWVAALLGAALVVGSPLVAQADDGKWWDPQGRRPDRERRVERTHRDDSRNDRGQHRGWRNGRPRFQRDVVVIRDGRGPRFRAHRVYVRPVFFESQHLCVVRPVRYFVGASAAIGGVRLHARFHDDVRYGCNFCDARFADYRGYRRHVVRCDDRPHGYRFEVRDWEDDWCDDDCEYDHHGRHDW
ncbi:MAG TPA: hypothetical protein VFM17_05920 [Candidatus Eisenbacteria bacterium]|nr:hypothetical protein [Candidatus Eisenbacteria bacterium]